MQKNEFDNEMKKLSLGVYEKNKNSIPKDWISVMEAQNKQSGFYGQTFFKNNKIVISFRGTDIKTNDIVFQDIPMGLAGRIPSQYSDAQDFYELVKDNFPNQEISFTGHSLGGSLAQLMSNKTGCKAVTFNAFGTANLLDGSIIRNNDNIINYGNIDDVIFNLNLDNQLGKTYIIGADKTGDYVSKFNSCEENNNLGLKKHFIENMGDIEDAVEYKPARLEGKIEMNVSKYNDMDRFFTREDIENMTSDEYVKNERMINRQLKKYGTILTKAQANKQVKSGNLIWINSYTRENGTEVKGYYRSRPSKG